MVSQANGGDSLPIAIITACVVIAVAFLIVFQSGGFLEIAIKQAIEDGRVILGMTKDDVISSWGRPQHAEKPNLEIKVLDELVALTWTYEGPHCVVYFNGDGIVILAKCDSED
jgi:hypothetical protein